MEILKTIKHHFSSANISVSMLFWMCLLCQTNLAYASWDAASVTIAAYSDSPQHACEYWNIYRGGAVYSYRTAWVLERGYEGGFYTPGFDVQGPAIPNPENNYEPTTPGSSMYCIYGDSLGDYIAHLTYFPDQQSLQLTVSGLTETRPAGTGGASTIVHIVKVTSGGTPKPGVALRFSSDVTPNSGGHEHHDAARPKGALSTAQGITDANGEVQVTFKAPEIAGIHTIKATCATCSNSPATKEIQVKVPDLVKMKPDTKAPPSYALVGQTGNHASNHWFTPGSVATLHKVADAMFKTGWGAVGVNDGSLAWGGLFDIKGGWSPSHHEHRMGTEVDLSVTNPRKATDEQKKKTYRELCRKDSTAFSVQTLWHQDDGYPEHFHMYLDGTGLTSQAAGGPCCARYKTTRAKKDKSGNPVLDKNGQPVQETVALCEETSPR